MKHMSVSKKCSNCRDYKNKNCKGLLVYDNRDCPIKVRHWRKQ